MKDGTVAGEAAPPPPRQSPYDDAPRRDNSHPHDDSPPGPARDLGRRQGVAALVAPGAEGGPAGRPRRAGVPGALDLLCGLWRELAGEMRRCLGRRQVVCGGLIWAVSVSYFVLRRLLPEFGPATADYFMWAIFALYLISLPRRPSRPQ